MTALAVHHVVRSFGSVVALDDVSFTVDTGSTVALLGPSGCGKTTLLRIIAGFERPDSGSVSLDGETVTGEGRWQRPELRSIGYVAQEGALFPHLTVAGNIEFALTRAERRDGQRVAGLLELVSLDTDLLRRFPHQLSGGQQQRVALARALARRPGLMLLDEPFAALDASLRTGTRELMAAALAAEKVTTVLVTHDQEEAPSFADQVVVLRDGRIRQAGTPRELYERPADSWTAGFVGDAVLLPAEFDNGCASTVLGGLRVCSPVPVGATTVLLRPEQLRLTPLAGGGSAAHGSGTGEVVGISYLGHHSVCTVKLDQAPGAVVRCRGVDQDAPLSLGDRVTVSVAGSAVAMPAVNG